MTKPEDLQKMLDELLDLSEGLTDWEMDFLDSLSNRKNDFTYKQSKVLERLWDKCF